MTSTAQWRSDIAPLCVAIILAACGGAAESTSATTESLHDGGSAATASPDSSVPDAGIWVLGSPDADSTGASPGPAQASPPPPNACAMSNGEYCPKGATCWLGRQCSEGAVGPYVCECQALSSGALVCATGCAGDGSSPQPSSCPADCASGYAQDPATCGCIVPGIPYVEGAQESPPTSCHIDGWGDCAVNTSCAVATCDATGGQVVCSCNADGTVSCNSSLSKPCTDAG